MIHQRVSTQEGIAMDIIMENGFVVGAASFTTGFVRRKSTLYPYPLTPDQVLAWAIQFEACGFPHVADDLINRCCKGETIYRC